MARPVLVLVDDEDVSRQALTRELDARYGAHYQIVSGSSPELVLARLREFLAEGVAVPLVLADQWMPGMTGAEFLARVKDVVPTTRRGLLFSWFDRSSSGPILEALAAGQMDFYLPKPVWSPDEQFHRAITESLEEWWREQGGRFEAVTVIGEEPSLRTHEIRDILARNSVPFGFYRSDSEEGRAALARLGVVQPAGPVVALYNGIVLVNPDNAEVAEAGLYGWTWGGCGYIDLLWVRDDERGQGLGAGLLATAEAEIRRRGCDRVALNTHSFQAPGFYARFGYTECGRTPGYPHGHDDIHLVKQFR